MAIVDNVDKHCQFVIVWYDRNCNMTLRTMDTSHIRLVSLIGVLANRHLSLSLSLEFPSQRSNFVSHPVVALGVPINLKVAEGCWLIAEELYHTYFAALPLSANTFVGWNSSASWAWTRLEWLLIPVIYDLISEHICYHVWCKCGSSIIAWHVVVAVSRIESIVHVLGQERHAQFSYLLSSDESIQLPLSQMFLSVK